MDATSSSPDTTPRSRYTAALAASLAALGGLLFGYDTGVVSGALLFLREEFALSSVQQGIVVSVMQLGAVAGALLCGPMSDRWGRRLALAVAAGAFIAGGLLAAYATSYEWLVLARVLQGLGVGAAALTVPVYIAEIAPPRIRGTLVSLNQLLITVGILLAYVVNYAFAPSGAWRWMFGLAAIPASVLLIALLFLPESPRWLIARGRSEQARAVMSTVAGQGQVDAELQEMHRSVRQDEGGLRALFGRAARPALTVGLLLALLQTITGIDTVIYFAPTILDNAGFDTASSTLSTVGIGTVNVAVTIVSLFLLDRVGRRAPLIGGTIVMAISMASLAIIFATAADSANSLSVLAMMAFVGAFAIGLGPVFWLINSEIYPLRLRAQAAGLATMTIFGSNAIVSATFLPLVNALGQSGVFLLYCTITVLAVVFMYRRVPETRGQTLEHIQHSLRTRQKTTPVDKGRSTT